ncbi:thymidylate synthase [Halorubrum virus Serpecor1]|uniref:FAD-dependent thymidylate synthase ThyX n=1 Tax=Halorubrum virus Serpecor1 TaxID=2721757 RepID=A0A6G9RW55_9CAUD|nr:thymidylate synthase [Halorubrum virus Serpecor1]QIR31217.1 FAD-dependent thymidylate synthase ThyX [Halorubrum virus Serpecor1]
MKVELKTEYSTPNADDVPVMAARGDYMSESLVGKTVEDALAGTSKTQEELLKELLRRGHFGPFEHIQAFFAVEGLSRSAMAQVTRHRHMSFDVQSQRYCDFSEKNIVVPPGDKNNPSAEDVVLGQYDGAVEDFTGRDAFEGHFVNSVELYERLIEQGMAKEDARFVLPIGVEVDLTFSANARTLMHFFDLRKNMKAQWEAREFATKVLDECMEWSPLVFSAYEEVTNNNSIIAP